jgi:hypothetical protein
LLEKPVIRSLFSKIGVRNSSSMSRYATPVIRLWEKENVPSTVYFGKACEVEKRIHAEFMKRKVKERDHLQKVCQAILRLFLKK